MKITVMTVLGIISIFSVLAGCGNKNQGIADIKMKEALESNAERVDAESRKIVEERYRSIHSARETQRMAAEAKALADFKARTEKISEIEATVRKYDDKLQAFSVHEAPGVWQTRLYFMAEIEVLDEKIEAIKATYVQHGSDASKDKSLLELCKLRNKLVRRVRRIEDKLVDSMLAAGKVQANPDNESYQADAQKKLMGCIIFADEEKKQYLSQKSGRRVK